VNQTGWRLLVKRAVDRTLGTAARLAAAPVMIGVAAVVRVALGKPVIFRQRRPGLRGQPFTIYKFRTMTDATDATGRPLDDAARLTRLGKFLRSTSLDELPQLWNVAKGELSLVGPRPLLMEYLPLYTQEQARRHDVLPGITGVAQINGRNAISWEEKFAYDVWYVDNWSLVLDASLLAKTAWRVFRREDTTHEGHVTMPNFTGSPE
jgi:sugar transferase EpsL